jgi:hypothetical protein
VEDIMTKKTRYCAAALAVGTALSGTAAMALEPIERLGKSIFFDET